MFIKIFKYFKLGYNMGCFRKYLLVHNGFTDQDLIQSEEINRLKIKNKSTSN